jgi:predicted RNase H-like nuclease (RuvC/YqgF family)
MADFQKAMEPTYRDIISRQQTEIENLERQRNQLQLECNAGLEAKRKAVRECAQLKSRLATYRTRLERLERGCTVWQSKVHALEDLRDKLQRRLAAAFKANLAKAAPGECDNQSQSDVTVLPGSIGVVVDKTDATEKSATASVAPAEVKEIKIQADRIPMVPESGVFGNAAGGQGNAPQSAEYVTFGRVYNSFQVKIKVILSWASRSRCLHARVGMQQDSMCARQ